MMAHGNLPHVCSVLNQVDVPNAMKADVKEWVADPNRQNLPCFMQNSSVNQSMRGGEVGQMYNATCRLFTDPKVNARNKIVFNGQEYDFVAVDNLKNLNRVWVIYLLAQTNQGNPGNTDDTNKVPVKKP